VGKVACDLRPGFIERLTHGFQGLGAETCPIQQFGMFQSQVSRPHANTANHNTELPAENGTEPEPQEWQEAFVQEHYREPDEEQEPAPQNPKVDGQITNEEAE
jgi:hypothetical protein